jgi:hypothetical protein
MLAYIDAIEAKAPASKTIVVMPKLAPKHFWEAVPHNGSAGRLKKALAKRPRTYVVKVSYQPDGGAGEPPVP